MSAIRLSARFAVIALAAVVLAGCSGFTPPTAGGSGGGDVPAGETDAFAIGIGDCLNDAEVSSEVTTVPLVDCAEPHDSEVFARTDSTAATFPGTNALGDELDAFCQGEAFSQFVGIAYDASEYATSGYYPTEGSWENGDRELLCTIFDPSGRVIGSLAGAAR